MSLVMPGSSRKVRFVPDMLGELVRKTSTALTSDPDYIRYDYGHYKVVENNLINKDNAITPDARRKYPLVWLAMDFEETKNRLTGEAFLPDLQIIIATDTDVNYTMQERRDKSYFAKLLPIEEELIRQLEKSRDFMLKPTDSYSSWFRPYWGIQSGDGNGQANMFSDVIDAIQIKNLKLVAKNVC